MTKPNNNKAETFKFGNRTSAMNDIHKPVAITEQMKILENKKDPKLIFYHP